MGARPRVWLLALGTLVLFVGIGIALWPPPPAEPPAPEVKPPARKVSPYIAASNAAPKRPATPPLPVPPRAAPVSAGAPEWHAIPQDYYWKQRISTARVGKAVRVLNEPVDPSDEGAVVDREVRHIVETVRAERGATGCAKQARSALTRARIELAKRGHPVGPTTLEVYLQIVVDQVQSHFPYYRYPVDTLAPYDEWPLLDDERRGLDEALACLPEELRP